MRCLGCGTEMVATQSEPCEGLSEIAYYTLQCPSCGDTERRLLPRDRVSATEVLRSTNAEIAASLPTPQEKLGRAMDREAPRVAAKLRDKSPASRRNWTRINELMKNPTNFIASMVHERERKD